MHTWKSQSPNNQIDAVSARRVLRDAYISCREFSKALESGDIARIRRGWIAAITLLRTVGHVLNKVDETRSRWLKEIGKREFARIKNDRFGNLIYWEFIDAERNLVLKEYQASIFEKVHNPENPRKVGIQITGVLVGTDLHRPEEALSAALKWWEDYLERIESGAAAARRANKR